MARVLFIQVPLDDDGRPDLQLPASVDLQRLCPGVFMLSHQDEALVVSRIGTRNGEPVFLACTTTPGVVQRLEHLGARVRTLAQVRRTPALWNWLLGCGLPLVRDESDTIIGVMPSVVIAGQSGISLAQDDEE